jgi:hypothetical protein
VLPHRWLLNIVKNLTIFEVSSTENLLREAIVDAEDEEQAEEIACAQHRGVTHHHTADVWWDNWHVQHYEVPRSKCYCLECGQRRYEQ